MKSPPAKSELTVIKIGGGLSRIPGALQRVCDEIGRIGRTHPLVAVPGGGTFADAIRAFDTKAGLDSESAHWMAILAMDLYGHVLGDHIRSAELVDGPESILAVVCRGNVAVLAPYRWMRAADDLPHTWGVTSDSIAAFVAGALGAVRLVLVKPAPGDEVVDPYFRATLPLGMPYRIIGWDAIEELEPWLSE